MENASAELWPGSTYVLKAYRLNVLGIAMAIDLARRRGPFSSALRLRPDLGSRGVGGPVSLDQWQGEHPLPCVAQPPLPRVLLRDFASRRAAFNRVVHNKRQIFRCGTFKAWHPRPAVVNGDNCFGGAYSSVDQLVQLWYEGIGVAAQDERTAGHPELSMEWAARSLSYSFLPR